MKLIIFVKFWYRNGGNNAEVILIFFGFLKSFSKLILTSAPVVLNTKVVPFDLLYLID